MLNSFYSVFRVYWQRVRHTKSNRSSHTIQHARQHTHCDVFWATLDLPGDGSNDLPVICVLLLIGVTS